MTTLKLVEAEARLLWQVGPSGTTGKITRSFWIGKSDEPRCLLEKLSLAIARFHYPGPAWRRVLGVESWVQLRSVEDTKSARGLEFHYDKDEIAVKKWDIWSHPELSTVTYLSGCGAPLVVFSTTSNEGQSSEEEELTEEESEQSSLKQSDDPTQALPSHGWICFPRVGRHVAFDGRLLHGVPAELLDLSMPMVRASRDCAKKRRHAKQESQRHIKRRRFSADDMPKDRVSFLVNVWTSHNPTDDRRLPARIASRLAAASRSSARTFSDLPKTDQLLCLGTGAKPLDPWVHVIPACMPLGAHDARRRRLQQLHKLKEHSDRDTGLLPIPAIVSAREGHSRGPAGKGLLALQYVVPKASKQQHPRRLLRRRPASASK